MSALDKCVEVAERCALQFTSDTPQPDGFACYQRAVTPSQIAREGFPKFNRLPAELRSKIWQYAMPPYGLYTVLMLGREEPKPEQPPAPAPVAFRIVYRLEFLPREQRDDKLRYRLKTMRAIQRTCSEAAAEVARAFPTTIRRTAGKLRFNADHDILVLSDLPCSLSLGLLARFRRYHQGGISFADDWHKVPRRMVMNNLPLWKELSEIEEWLKEPKWYRPVLGDIQDVEGFMKFLADCDRLDTFGLIYGYCGADKIAPRPEQMESYLAAVSSCYPAPPMPWPFYKTPSGFRGTMDSMTPMTFARGINGLKALIHGLRDGQTCWQEEAKSKFGRPDLQHLQFRAMMPANPKFHHHMLQDGME